MKKDYYEILGIPKQADVQQIKKAYRSMALKYHPDRVEAGQKKEAEERFKEISEAYGVLSDPEKRKLYDQYGHSGIDQTYTTEDIFRGADFNSIFGEAGLGDVLGQLFGEAVFGGMGGGAGQGARPRRGRDIQYEVEISLDESFSGVKKNIKVPRYETCTHCHGTGAKNGTALKTCPTCQGRGQVVMASGFFRMAQTCSTCGGQGKTITEHCPPCNGKGKIKITRNIDVTIPAGVGNDNNLRVRGEGEVGTAGAGDLYLYILVKSHPIFSREGNDLHMDLPVSFVMAALGSDADVPTLSGKVAMKIPAGTQSGRIFRLKGRGMPDVHGRGHGDQYVRVMLQVPTHLSHEQKRLLEEFAGISGANPALSEESFTEKIKKVFK